MTRWAAWKFYTFWVTVAVVGNVVGWWAVYEFLVRPW